MPDGRTALTGAERKRRYDRRVRVELGLLLWLGREHERMPLASARIDCFRGLRLRNIFRVHGDDTSSFGMCGHHYGIGVILAHFEDRFQDRDDKLSRRVVVIE